MPKVFIAGLIVFLIMVNALVGFRSVNPNALALLESLAASRSEIFLRLRLPSSLPLPVRRLPRQHPYRRDRRRGGGVVQRRPRPGQRHLRLEQQPRHGNRLRRRVTLAIIGVGLFLATTALRSASCSGTRAPGT